MFLVTTVRGNSVMNTFVENILVVDDEEAIRRMLCKKLDTVGYTCHVAANGEQAFEAMNANQISLVILDINMPGKSGEELLPEIMSKYPDTQVVMVTASSDINTAIRCMRDGAYDFLTKPFNFDEILFSIRRALEKRRLEMANREYQLHLESRVSEQAEKIRLSFMNAITALANALEAKDSYTAGHSKRVADISVAIANAMGLMQETNEKIKTAGMVHDIGKIGISEHILNKPGSLTREEFHQIQTHSELGQRILKPVAGDEDILNMVRSHHEHYDGSGYPDGLKQHQIPLGSRIIAVADAYEAMTSERPYRSAMSSTAALVEIERGEGTQFDPDVAEAFLKSFRNDTLARLEPESISL